MSESELEGAVYARFASLSSQALPPLSSQLAIASSTMPPCRITLVVALASVSAALLISPLSVTTPLARSRIPQLSTDDDFPSDDYSGEAAPVPEVATAATATAAPVSAEIGPLKQQLLALAAGCNRGEAATTSDLAAARSLIERLELLSPIAEPTLAPEVRLVLQREHCTPWPCCTHPLPCCRTPSGAGDVGPGVLGHAALPLVALLHGRSCRLRRRPAGRPVRLVL